MLNKYLSSGFFGWQKSLIFPITAGLGKTTLYPFSWWSKANQKAGHDCDAKAQAKAEADTAQSDHPPANKASQETDHGETDNWVLSGWRDSIYFREAEAVEAHRQATAPTRGDRRLSVRKRERGGDDDSEETHDQSTTSHNYRTHDHNQPGGGGGRGSGSGGGRSGYSLLSGCRLHKWRLQVPPDVQQGK